MMNRKQRRSQKYDILSDEEALKLAMGLHQAGRLTEAIKAYAKVNPLNEKAHSYQGAALFDLGRVSDAVAAYEKAIALRPDFADAHYNLGLAQKTLGHLDRALVSYQTAISLNPQMAKAYSNLANVLRELGSLSQAEDLCRQALALKPDYAEAYANLGNALLDQARPSEAVTAYQKATALKPDLMDAHWGEAFSRLLMGDWALGWRKYEARWYQSGRQPHGFKGPQWQGESLTGTVILVHCEQGLGDSIQFIRYVPLLKQRGAAKVVLLCQQSLGSMFAKLPGIDEIVSNPKKIGAYDLQIPLLSLPLAFGTTEASIPAAVPYLGADESKRAYWADRLGREGFKIGIAWQGNPKAAADKGRSIPVAHFAGLAEIPSVRLISLQKADGTEQLAHLPQPQRIESLGPKFDEGPDAFSDTMAVMANLDLVITSDTAIAHLAGALAVKTWVVLQHSPDWRWLLDRNDSPWYPTMSLFRQTNPGDWSGPFARMRQALLAR